MLAALGHFQHVCGAALRLWNFFSPDIGGFFSLQTADSMCEAFTEKQNNCRNWTSDLHVLANSISFQERTVLFFL